MSMMMQALMMYGVIAILAAVVWWAITEGGDR